MWVSRLRARFQGLQIQWLSSPLGAQGLARLCLCPPAQALSPQVCGYRRGTQPPLVSQRCLETGAWGVRSCTLVEG